MIYIYTFAASIFFAYLADRSKDKGIIIICSGISILILSILGALRAYGIGTDTGAYGRPHAMAALHSPDFWTYFWSGKEVLYNAVVYLAMRIFTTENGAYLFQQVITHSCVYIGLWKHRKIAPLPLLLLVYIMQNYNATYNMIRQSMAISIVFMGVNNVEEKHYARFLVYVVIATMFHSSAPVALLIAAIHALTSSKILKSNKFYASVAVCVVFGLMFLIRPVIYFSVANITLFEKYIGYTSSTSVYFDMSMTSHSLINAGTLLVLVLYRNGAIKAFGRDNTNFYTYNVLFLIAYNIFVRFVSYRVILYSHFINIIPLSLLFRCIKEKNMKIMMFFAVIGVIMFYWWYMFVYSGVDATWPYRSIFD